MAAQQHLGRRARRLIGLVAGVLLAGAGGTGVAQSPAPWPYRHLDAAEFPPHEASTFRFLERGHDADVVLQRLRDDPHHPDIPRLLLSLGRITQGLDALQRIAAARPDRIAEAFDGARRTVRYGGDRHRDDTLTTLAAARDNLDRLPRERAAVAARLLLDFETDWVRPALPDYDARRRAFVVEYAGTDAARLAEVDRITNDLQGLARLDALEAFARRHAGTTAAAKATYYAGRSLAASGHDVGFETQRGDPTARLLRVVEIVADLESGRYPRCEWVENAWYLLSDFFALEPRYERPENVDTILSHYRRVAVRELRRAADPTDDRINFLIVTRMGDLFAIGGDRLAGIESVYAAAAQTAPNPTAIRYASAVAYVAATMLKPDLREAARPLVVERLRGVAAENVEPFSRRALATLASIYFHDTRDHAAAASTYQQYVSRYPASDWAWVAHVRLGQSAAAQGDLTAAADVFARAAALTGPPRAAQALALAFAAEIHAELGQVARAREDATRALALWNDDVGEEYYTGDGEAQVEGEESFGRSDPTTIRKVDLIDRVARLTRADGAPGGAALEQGRRLLARGALDRALPVLERAVADSRTTPLEPDARRILHEARLRQALALADVDRVDRQPDEAMRLLDALGAETPDVVTTFARVARATMLAQREGATPAAVDDMRQALETWRARQPLIAAPPAGSLEADVIAIRAEVFRPLGGGVYENSRWNAFDWPLQLPPFVVLDPDLSVRIGEGLLQRVSVPHAIPGLDSAIYLNDDERALLATVIIALGGRTRGTPVSVMQTPNQPAGQALDVMAFWNRVFPMRQGHWRGWVFETSPAITEITFTDAARTSAAVRVTIGYSGATVRLEKVDGAWRAVGLTDQWIT